MTEAVAPAARKTAAPPAFPVVWEDPDDAAAYWNPDRMHSPSPMSPLGWWVWSYAVTAGFNYGCELYDMGLRLLTRRINTYPYVAVRPVARSPEVASRSEQKLEAAMAGLGARWRDEWLPAIRGHLAFWDGFDRSGAAPDAFLAHFDESLRRAEALWRIHFEIVHPAYLAISLFDDLYHDLFGGADAFEGHRLLQGLPNKTVESGQALWRLSREVLASPRLRDVVAGTPAERVVAALGGSAEGEAFLARLRAYLDEYGHRGHDWDLIAPRWTEDPTPAIRMLREYAAQPELDLAAEAALLAAERERLVADARRRLAGYPRAAVERFESLLEAAQVGLVLTEDHGFWIDFRGMSAFRRVAVEAGSRLVAAGALTAPSDVFYLRPDEIRSGLTGGSAVDRRPVVAERKAEMERFRSVVPPPIGTPPAGPPPDDPVTRSIIRFVGGPPPAPSAEAGVLRGHPGSPGQARGVARVVRSLAEADRLAPGEVLVAPTTAPPWTPLFGTAAAVVTDTGGILSHCAVVAREYGLPAVVGTGSATGLIPDGALVEVDGDAGTVRLL